MKNTLVVLALAAAAFAAVAARQTVNTKGFAQVAQCCDPPPNNPCDPRPNCDDK